MRRLLHGLLGATLLLGACGGDDDDGRAAAITSIPEETSTSTSSTTTEPRTVAPDVIPQDVDLITEEYVEQVLNKLFEVSLQAFLTSRDEGVVEERAMALLEATSSDEVFEQRVNDLADFAFSGFSEMKQEPSAVLISVLDLLEVTPSCIVAEVTTDASGMMTDPPPVEPEERAFVRLYAAGPEQRATGLNPTAWVLDEFPVTFDGTVPDLNCEGQ
jgi:hypothetical protein